MALPPLLADIGKDSSCCRKKRENTKEEVREVAMNFVLADGEMGVDAVKTTVKKYGIFYFFRIIGVG
jgi:hypothetical protein